MAKKVKIEGIRIEPAENGGVLEVSVCYPGEEEYGSRYEVKRKVFTKDNMESALLPALKKLLKMDADVEEDEKMIEGMD